MMNAVSNPHHDEPHDAVPGFAAGRHGVIFAGGGTGGHIFPGLAIAEKFEASACGEVECAFAVSDRPLDAEILRHAGRRFVVIPAAPFSVRPGRMLRFVRSWVPAVRGARAMIAAMRGRCPAGVEVLAMGGFVAGPVVRAANLLDVPVTLVNLDAVPGLANRWIARRAGRVCSAIELQPGALGVRLDVEVVGPIVRSAAIAPGSAADCRRRLGLDPDRPTLLVTGASQGARSINAFLAAFAEHHAGWLRQDRWQIIHQTGKGEAAAAERVYAQAGVPALVAEFLEQMGVAWGAADVAVTRCGAGSVAEAWANAVPSVMLPYPYHKDQHQRQNAQVLVRAGAAAVCDDVVDPLANLRTVGPVLESLMNDRARLDAMRRAFRALGPAIGAGRIAGLIMAGWSRSSAGATEPADPQYH